MKQLKLRKLTMRSFRSFVDETTIDFPASGLLLLQGRNGSGKSTIALAIAYAWGFCPYPATQLQSWPWLTTQKMYVKLELDSEAGPVIIERGATNAVTVNGVATKGSAVAIEAKLKQISGLETELLAALTYRPQQTRGMFLAATDKEKKEFLTTLLGLRKYEDTAKSSAELVRLAELDYENKSASATMIERGLNEIRNQVPTISVDNDRERQIDSRVAECEGQKVRLEGQLRLVQDTLKVMQEKLGAAEYELAQQSMQAAGNPFGPMDYSKLQELEKHQKDIRAKLEKIIAEDAKAEAARLSDILLFKDNANKYRAEIAKMASNTCPTCEQQWVEAPTALVRTQEKLAIVEAGLKHLEPPFEQSPKIARYRDMLQQIAAKIIEEKTAIDARREEYRQQQEAAVAKLYAPLEEERKNLNIKKDELAVQQQRLYTATEELLTILDEQSEFAANKASIERTWALYQQRLQSMEGSNNQAQNIAAAAKNILDRERDFAALVGREGFLGSIFDEVLVEISDETNRVLGMLPNTSHLTFRLASERETSTGSIAKAIQPVILINGTEVPLKSACSGGMYLSVEQAVDLAVNRVVSRRMGVYPGWLVMDECFGDQDLPTKEECMAVLREFAKDRLVIVVDHATEFKEAFTQFVNIKTTAGQSTVDTV